MVVKDYTVRLDEVFQGPLDLLLHLVRQQEVDIHEVSIASVIEGYFEYLEALEKMDLEVAGDFLVMAANLMAIKSRALLPGEGIELEDELDPEDELIQRLVEYRRFKGAADDLEDRWAQRALESARGYRAEVKDNEPEKTLDLGELTSFDLLASFSRLLRETLANRPHRVKGEARSLRWYVREVAQAVRQNDGVALGPLVGSLEGQQTPEGVIGVFCALLELMKLGVMTASQECEGGEITLSLASAGVADDLDDLIGHSQFLDERSPDGGRLGDDDPGDDDEPDSSLR